MEEKGAESKRPEETDFKQQRIKAWQPLLTQQWIIFALFMIGLVFIPVGAAVLAISGTVSTICLVVARVVYSTLMLGVYLVHDG